MVKFDAELIDASRVIPERFRLDHVIFCPLDVHLEHVDSIAPDYREQLVHGHDIDLDRLAADVCLGPERAGDVRRVVWEIEGVVDRRCLPRLFKEPDLIVVQGR